MIGRTLGSYQVLAKLGEGGMGEVYLAHDTRLGRDVALKVLPASVAHDPARRVRFDREARLLATLNHANIAAIHGVADTDDQVALVLELVEGPTLADRLASGPLPLAEALSIARQIGDALEAAHEKRIIHRDLKPQNIKFTSSGGVKLLDFGIAKALAADDAEVLEAPTATASTRAGAVLGTAAYMSPEQARGQPIDKRTDIWAFGCVLYEMLTGRTAFAGPTLSDTLAAVLERDPDWTALPSATPAHLRRLLHRSLDKDPRRRLRDIGDAVVDLVPDHGVEASTVTAPAVVPRAGAWRLVVAALGLVFATALITHIAWPARQSPEPTAAGSVRFTVAPPDGWRFGSSVPDVETTYLALSPDGSQLAFVATPTGGTGPGPQPGTSAVWLRPLATLHARPLSGTDGAISVFWSPDGRSVAFFAGDKLKRLDLPDGAPVPIADVPTRLGRTGTWGDGRILFHSVQLNDIRGVSTAGGTPAPVVSLDSSGQQPSRLYWPRFLPDGQRALYLAAQADGQGDLRLLDRSGASRVLMRVASNVEYVDPGYLVFVRDSTLLGQRFDAPTGTVAGEPFAIAEEIDYHFYPPRAAFSASRTGTIAYQPHRDVSRLVWIDQGGKHTASVGAPAGYFSMRMSRDRNHLSIAIRDDRAGTQDLWTLDLARGGMQGRLTTDPRPELPGPWLPGANALIYAAARGGPPQLFHRDLGSGVDRELLPAGEFHLPSDITPDGREIVFAQRTEVSGGWDLWRLSLNQEATRSPLITTPFSELDGRLSPDGKLLAFVSDEAKRFNVYVTSFPPSGRPRQVSVDGGTLPRWRPDGRELFYMSGTREIMAAPIRTAPALEVGPARALFSIGQRPWVDFDVAADGRFLALVAQVIAREQPVTVIVNWPAALRR